MIELNTLLEMGEELARKLLLEERHRELMPTYHLIGADESHHVFQCPWKNDLQKDMYLSAVKQLARKIHCRAFVFISEGWSVTRSTTDMFKGPLPSKDPDRIEVVNISAMNDTGGAAILLHMVRDLSPGMNNRLIALEPMHRLNDTGGRMVEGLIQCTSS